MSRHVLLVEDDQDIRDILREFIAAAGYLVTTAANAAGAAALAEACAFDAFVVDCGLPDKTGHQLICDLTAASLIPDSRVVMMTAALLQPVHPNIRAVLHKPFEIEELVLLLDGICGAST